MMSNPVVQSVVGGFCEAPIDRISGAVGQSHGVCNPPGPMHSSNQMHASSNQSIHRDSLIGSGCSSVTAASLLVGSSAALACSEAVPMSPFCHPTPDLSHKTQAQPAGRATTDARRPSLQQQARGNSSHRGGAPLLPAPGAWLRARAHHGGSRKQRRPAGVCGRAGDAHDGAH